MVTRILAIMLCVVFASSCAEEQRASETAPRKVKYEVVSESCDTNASTTLPAKVISAAETACSFRVAGVLESVDCREGERVERGQVIARLDSRDYETQLMATQAEYDAISGEVARVVKLYEQRSIPQNDYEKAISGLKQITAKLEAHKNAVGDTKLRAPYAGYIQRSNFDRGAALSAGMPVVSIISSSRPEVVVNIPAKEYIRRNELKSATATIELFPGEIFPLKMLGVSHKANLNGLYKAHFQLSAAGEKSPTAGMVAMVELSYPSAKNPTLDIPLSAVVSEDNTTYVWVIGEGNKISKRKVTLSTISHDNRVKLQGGVSVGERIITAGVDRLTEGQEVRLLERQSASNIGNLL